MKGTKKNKLYSEQMFKDLITTGQLPMSLRFERDGQIHEVELGGAESQPMPRSTRLPNRSVTTERPVR